MNALRAKNAIVGKDSRPVPFKLPSLFVLLFMPFSFFYYPVCLRHRQRDCGCGRHTNSPSVSFLTLKNENYTKRRLSFKQLFMCF